MHHVHACGLNDLTHLTHMDIHSLINDILQAIRKPRPPPVLKDHYDEAEYKKTQAYNIDKWCAGICLILMTSLSFFTIGLLVGA